jgi:hypothetical protein
MGRTDPYAAQVLPKLPLQGVLRGPALGQSCPKEPGANVALPAMAAFALADLLSRRGLERPCELLVAWARRPP